MELKTINDMAELSSILGGGNSQPAPGGGENKSSQNQQFLVQNKPNAYAFQGHVLKKFAPFKSSALLMFNFIFLTVSYFTRLIQHPCQVSMRVLFYSSKPLF